MSINDKILKISSRLPDSLVLSFLKANKWPELIYGKEYINHRKFLQDRSKEYDNTHQLLSMANFAIQNIPFYKEKYKNLKISSIEEFQKEIEPINKNVVVNNFSKFFNPRINLKEYEVVTTGGTTGAPMRILLPKNRYIIEYATIHELWKRVGYNKHVRAVIRNAKLPKGKDYIVNPVHREVIFDGFRQTRDYYRSIYKFLKENNIKYIHSYSSNAYEFGKFLQEEGLDTSFLNAFLTSSENVYDFQLDLFKRLGVPHYNFYGHTEKTVIAGYCESTIHYHVEPSYGFCELLTENETNQATHGDTGEVTTTTLNNIGFPLLRYKTGDLVEYLADYCPSCNRKTMIWNKIEGRTGDKIFNFNGTFVTTTALNLHNDLLEATNGIQYLQKCPGHLKVLVVKGSNFNQEHERRLLNHYKSKFEDDLELELEYIEELIKNKNGKFTILVKDLP